MLDREKIFDTHAHMLDESFDPDREELLRESFKTVQGFMEIGFNTESSEKAVSFAKDLNQKGFSVYASAGIHPDSCREADERHLEIIRSLSRDPICRAIGEIGLDYHYMPEDRDMQQECFRRQLRIAKEEGKPVNIHSRDAGEDTLRILEEESYFKGIIHCFSYSKEMAERFVAMGFLIGVGGVVTFKNSRKLKETVERLPIEKIVLETDSPYMSPHPFRGERNFPGRLLYVCESIAEIKNMPVSEVIRKTSENAEMIYDI